MTFWDLKVFKTPSKSNHHSFFGNWHQRVGFLQACDGSDEAKIKFKEGREDFDMSLVVPLSRWAQEQPISREDFSDEDDSSDDESDDSDDEPIRIPKRKKRKRKEKSKADPKPKKRMKIPKKEIEIRQRAPPPPPPLLPNRRPSKIPSKPMN